MSGSQSSRGRISNVMSSIVSAFKQFGVLACCGAFPLLSWGGVKFNAEGGEYPIVGALQGDQVFPQVAVNPYGGFIVWQDNATDGDGYGISARRLAGTFRVIWACFG